MGDNPVCEEVQNLLVGRPLSGKGLMKKVPQIPDAGGIGDGLGGS
jgi:hypothetical protein